MAGEGSSEPGNAAGSQSNFAGFNTNQLPPDEAAVGPEIIRDEPDDPVVTEEEDGEVLIHDTFLDDYPKMEEQDNYESMGLNESYEDERDLDQIMQGKRAAEVELDVDVHEHDTNDESGRPPKRCRGNVHPSPGGRSFDGPHPEQSSPGRSHHGYSREVVPLFNEHKDESDNTDKLDCIQVKVQKWVTKADNRRLIAKKFKKFLLTYVNPMNKDVDYEYIRLIKEMVSAKKCTLEIDLFQFSDVHPRIANWLDDAPYPILDVMEEVANIVVLNMHPNYKSIHETIHIRITNYPAYYLIQNIRANPLNTMIRIGGVVTHRSGVIPQILLSKFDCNKCRFVLGPYSKISYPNVKLVSCPGCQSKGPFTLNREQTVYRNYQKLTLQESTENVPAGSLPRNTEVILLNDLIDCARPGEEIEVTGIYTDKFDQLLNTKNTVVEANHVTGKHDMFSAYYILTQEDRVEILNLAKDPRIGERIMKSIAPSIYGHEDIKTGIALAMFGGQEKNVEGKHRLRGDINVLLQGDPGTTMSQFLKYVEKTGQRAVYTTCKGASGGGITAAVYKDPVTQECTLEGGSLVLADKGICLIDEFDKMNDQDRVRIHEAMEQQSISISEAGIVTTLQARCSVIAAAHPIVGRGNSLKLFTQNVQLTDPLISQFDILCVVKDIVNPVKYEIPAELVVDSQFNSQARGVNLDDKAPINSQEVADMSPNQTDPGIIPQDLLKKYIIYAKLKVFPMLNDADLDRYTRIYAEVLRKSSHGRGVPIALRHRESIIRMSEAHARMHLRQHVTQVDVDMAISVLLDSFISTQKSGVQEALHKSGNKYTTSKKDYNEMVLHHLRGLEEEALHF